MVDGQLDSFVIAVKSGGEELKEAGEARKRQLEFRRRETHPGGPFALFFAVGDTQANLRIAKGSVRQRRGSRLADGSVGEIDSETCGDMFREYGIIRPRVEKTVYRIGSHQSDD